MRKVILSVASFIMATSVFAQDAKETEKNDWNYVANIAVNVSQTSFKNWALGGEGSIGGVAILNLGANYLNERNSWDNSLVAQYGIQKIDGETAKKSIDMFDINSKYGYKIAPKWSLAALVGIKSQFTKGYLYGANNERDMISNLFAPGYATTSLGIDFKPNNWFSALISPVTGKHTFVLDKQLSDMGAFGVEKGSKYRGELGMIVDAKMQRDIMQNVNLMSTLRLFSAYNHNFGNIDVNFDIALSMKVNKYISATVTASWLYDDDINFVNAKGVNEGPKIQFKEVIGVGLAYNFVD